MRKELIILLNSKHCCRGHHCLTISRKLSMNVLKLLEFCNLYWEELWFDHLRVLSFECLVWTETRPFGRHASVNIGGHNWCHCLWGKELEWLDSLLFIRVSWIAECAFNKLKIIKKECGLGQNSAIHTLDFCGTESASNIFILIIEARWTTSGLLETEFICFWLLCHCD